ncbi:hypothetical protein REPUB_Repub08aG0116700 [Reevesia pubescens]
MMRAEGIRLVNALDDILTKVLILERETKGKSDPSNLKDSASDPLVGGETVFYGTRNGIVADVAPAEGKAYTFMVINVCCMKLELSPRVSSMFSDQMWFLLDVNHSFRIQKAG